MEQQILLIGAGWLGKDLAVRLKNAGRQVMAIGRNAEICSELNIMNISALQLNMNSEISIQQIPASSIVIFLFPPSSAQGTEFTSYSNLIGSVYRVLKSKGLEYIIHISSSGIYPAKSGMYSEDAETDTTERALRLKEAEQAVLSSGILAAVIRAGGLCGKDRHPGIWNRTATVLAGDEPVNMIWKADLIELILHTVSKRLSGIYNAAAPMHPIREDFYKHCFLKMNTPLPEFSLGAAKTNRIVLSDKIISTGFEFGFPDPCKFPV